MLAIHGGKPLVGAVRVSGSKNAALPIMAASILAHGPVRLCYVPQLSDVATLASVLTELGMTVHRRVDGALHLETVDLRPIQASRRFVRRMRASFCVLGPLLARRRRAVVPLPGGCLIGDRPIDVHLRGLAALGANLRVVGDHCIAQASRLRGTTIDLRGPLGPTVTGTANVLSAAVVARGTTVLTSAACEPEIADLARFLVSLGARIEGIGESTLVVHGVDSLDGGQHTIIPDRIEAATLLLAGLVTGGSVIVEGACAEHLAVPLSTMQASGATITIDGQRITGAANETRKPFSIDARPYPGMPTDLQAQFTVLAGLAGGRSVVRDHVFPDRFAHLAALRRFGMLIERVENTALVVGQTSLSGARANATDLRASAALVLVALAADGRSTISGLRHLRRGYEALDEKLRSLGAHLRMSAPPRSAPVPMPGLLAAAK
ncbi:MAG TPA: UDP-N-acetylglucosamine 1-carboxyvinyltransferase [Pirellulales bacterium]|nr:UDP-N-acetylglucosamine 1-carboxyvinyltransferase [Pirellulales bacterium]